MYLERTWALVGFSDAQRDFQIDLVEIEFLTLAKILYQLSINVSYEYLMGFATNSTLMILVIHKHREYTSINTWCAASWAVAYFG